MMSSSDDIVMQAADPYPVANEPISLLSSDPDEPPAVDSEKKYKRFDFFYRRTAFRSMTEFYKGLFRPILEKWREGERKSTKNFVLSYFVKLSEIGETLVNLSGKATVKDLRLIEQLSRDQGKTAKNPGPQANKSRTKDPVEDKTIAGIRPTFEPFTSGRTDVEMPLSEKDKHIIKFIFTSPYRLAFFDTVVGGVAN